MPQRAAALMPLPRWIWRAIYDRESASWVRRRNEPEHQALVEQTVDRLAAVVEPPGQIADLGCGPGAHARALARRGFDVTGLDGSPKMIAVAQEEARREGTIVDFAVADANRRLPFDDASLGGAISILLLQHLRDPRAFVGEVARCLRPGGHLLLTAPARDVTPLTTPNLYWRIRAITARTPGIIRFFDEAQLVTLVESAGLTAVPHEPSPGGALVLARR